MADINECNFVFLVQLHISLIDNIHVSSSYTIRIMSVCVTRLANLLYMVFLWSLISILSFLLLRQDQAPRVKGVQC